MNTIRASFLLLCIWKQIVESICITQAFTQYKLKRCLNKDCCKQCRYVKFKGTKTKWPVQKLTKRTAQKHVQHDDATNI